MIPMIPITYLRSSSYNGWDVCQHKATIENFWGRRTPSNLAACRGNVLHKISQILALQKLAQQRGEAEFTEDEIPITIKTGEANIENASEWSLAHYKKLEPFHEWEDSATELELIRGWAYKGFVGRFDPRLRTIVDVEKFFDITFDDEWAHYHYEINGRIFDGQFGIKGTVDLILEDGQRLELVDWKTGKTNKCFATGKEKDLTTLQNDPQLLIYHYALAHLYPKYKDFAVTINFLNAGGPFTLLFNNDRLPETKEMLRRRFEEIRDCERPKLIIGDPVNNWKCKTSKVCKWGTTYTKKNGKSVTWCKKIADEIVELGIDKVTSKYINLDTVGTYGDGGGRSAK